MNTNNNQANANNEANTNPTTNAAEPKPTHGAGVKNHPCADLPKPDGKKVFGEIGRGTNDPIQAGVMIPISPCGDATEMFYFVNKFTLDKLDYLIKDMLEIGKREPQTKAEAMYQNGMYRGVILCELQNLRDMFSKIDLTIGAVMLDIIGARVKRSAKEYGAK